MGDTEKFEDFYANAERRIRELNKKRDDAMNETPQKIYAKIGELTLENDFLSGALGKAGLLGGKK